MSAAGSGTSSRPVLSIKGPDQLLRAEGSVEALEAGSILVAEEIYRHTVGSKSGPVLNE
jgi:hypothetical protein